MAKLQSKYYFNPMLHSPKPKKFGWFKEVQPELISKHAGGKMLILELFRVLRGVAGVPDVSPAPPGHG